MKHKITILIIALITVFPIWADSDITAPQNELTMFRNMASTGQPGASAYQSLYRAAQGFISAINGERSGSETYSLCKIALKEIFPKLADAAYFYAAQSNQEEVLKFACIYVDVSLLPCMGNENLRTSPRFGTLANLAATNLFNRRQYDRSIAYFQAYLESGETSARELAFEGLGRCYHEQKLYGQAANICYQASKIYPTNWNILVIGIESAGHNGNDPEMGEMLDLALRLQPNHVGLLEYQGKLFERQRMYEKAAQSFARLCALPGATLDHITHLGFDYYNAATLAYNRAKSNGSKTEMAHAKNLYNNAAPQLQTVLTNTPYAANVARALAFCYSVNQDATRLEEANRVLGSLNAPKVDFGSLPNIVQNYTPSADLNDTTNSVTKAIANGEPEKLISDVDIDIPVTGISNQNTFAIIIANENYSSHLSSKVDYAIHDGEIMAEYCRKVLGIPEDRIKYFPDASYLKMRNAIRDMKELSALKPGKLNVIFYYAGHGMPDQIGENSYIMPIDSDGRDPETMFSLEKLYADFDNMKARNVTVFLDACFSGQGRDAKTVYSARFVARDAADVVAKGNTVVFSAGTGLQVSNPYKEKGHGFFTYFLLKALQESKGRISLSDLHKELETNVAFEVRNKLGAQQTPTVKASDALGSTWRARTLLD